MNCCCSVLWLGSLMLFLAKDVNLIYICAVVNISWNNLVVIGGTTIWIEPCELLLAHSSSFLSIILAALREVHDVVASLWSTGRITAVFERYLVLGHIDSSCITWIRWSTISLTAQLILIMKAGVGQSIKRASILLEVLGLWHQRLWSWISSKSLYSTWSASLMSWFASIFHMVEGLIIQFLTLSGWIIYHQIF